jgi:hypothetical protein
MFSFAIRTPVNAATSSSDHFYHGEDIHESYIDKGADD